MDVTILICSVEQEAAPLLRMIEGVTHLAGRTFPAWEGSIGGVPVVIAAGGMGKSNAASSLTALLERHRAAGVIGFGIAGAYLAAGLDTGAVAVATSEHYGDEGVEAPTGWISTEAIGIPLVEREGARYFNDIPLDGALARLAAARLEAAGVPAALGPFVTVSACSGTAARGEALASRYSAICESMEGAAYAHVAALYGAPYLGIRAVSNLVEDRDLSRWEIPRATAAAAAAVHAVLTAGPLEPAGDI